MRKQNFMKFQSKMFLFQYHLDSATMISYNELLQQLVTAINRFFYPYCKNQILKKSKLYDAIKMGTSTKYYLWRSVKYSFTSSFTKSLSPRQRSLFFGIYGLYYKPFRL